MKIITSNHFDNTGYWVRNALGQYVFFKTGKRNLAQEKCNEMYGKGQYTVSKA